MALLIYTTGNGYSCSCCRRSSQDYNYFNEDDLDTLIEDCIKISRYAEGDFYINTIEGYSGDADELEKRITEAIEADEKAQSRAKDIEETRRAINLIDVWFAELDTSKEAKAVQRDKLKAKLVELEAS